MKRLILAIVVSAFAACGGETKNQEQEKNAPLAQSKNSAAFNQPFSQLLETYYHLKDALVLSNDTLASSYADKLALQADSLNVSSLNADNSIVEMVKGYVLSISSEAKGLTGEKDLEAKRKSFQMISDTLYDLVRTVKYDREVLYHQYCPMAFNDAGAYWLSKTDDIKNPYFGKKMLMCGEVKDTLDFTKQ